MFDYLSTGRAIIASNIPVFHEVLNEKIAVFCDPDNANDWVSAINRLSRNANLRLSMQEAALDAAKTYSWKNRARVSIDKLEKILK